ncbi:MAG: hypothetical protein IH600_02835 [Bacteroidetes bacterium]|nr:hypothetical protein [Bacteroidota bacterium]
MTLSKDLMSAIRLVHQQSVDPVVHVFAARWSMWYMSYAAHGYSMTLYSDGSAFHVIKESVFKESIFGRGNVERMRFTAFTDAVESYVRLLWEVTGHPCPQPDEDEYRSGRMMTDWRGRQVSSPEVLARA